MTHADHEALLAHYGRVGPLLVKQFGPIPLVAGFVPDWGSGAAVFEAWVEKPVPPSIATVVVHSTHYAGRFVALAENALLWQAHRGAVELLSWSPTRDDPSAVAFARILLTQAGTATEAMVKEAALVFRELLERAGIRAIPMLGGVGGVSLWIPFCDRPAYPPVRAWLHAVAREAEARHPKLISAEWPLSERGNRAHVAVDSNAPGRWSALPYSLRGFDGLPMVTPIGWDELATMWSGDVAAHNSGERVAAFGDVFVGEAAEIGDQRSATVLEPPRSIAIGFAEPAGAFAVAPVDFEPRGRILTAAIAILGDGKPRDAEQLCAEAIARGLVPRSTTHKYFYTALTEYIARQRGHDRRPLIVQDPDRRFRANHPADDWPAPTRWKPPGAPAGDAARLTARLREAANGKDPAAFEVAVCDAFAPMGFVATHVGGIAAPDGYLDAILGRLGYRVMLECKTAHGVVTQPNAVEAGKYRDAYHAQYATLVGPAFGEWVSLAGELQTHGVAAFTVDDIVRMLAAGLDAEEMRPLFEPGFAGEKLDALLWDREHGEAKRVAVVAKLSQLPCGTNRSLLPGPETLKTPR